ncbi:MAG: hypothetical protein KKB79_02630 [Nanoarchaeota archaeon]|nr:hypothetical protein [Nanoarchaeota archaeon]
MDLENMLVQKGKKYFRSILFGGMLTLTSLPNFSCGGDENPPTRSIDITPVTQEQNQDNSPPAQTPPPKQEPINHPPKITSTPITQVEENSTYQYRIQSNDPDGDILNYRLIDSPNWLSVTNDRISGTAPEVEVNTLLHVKVRVSDSRGGTADQAYNLLIENTKNTRTLSTDELNRISEINENSITFSDSKGFSEGDILVGGISDETPYGILREVIGVSNDRRTVQTRQATLEEALRDGILSFRQELSQENARSYKVVAGASKATGRGFGFSIDLKDVNLSMDSKDTWVEQGLIANGNISFNVEPILDIEVRRLRLEKLRAQIIMEEKAEIELRSNISLGTRGIEREIAGYQLTPIPIAGTPFVITPQIDIIIGIMPGKLNVLEARINQEAHLSPGALYENRGWKNLSDFSNSFDFFIQRAPEGTNIEIYAGPSLKLFLNGVLPGARICVNNSLRLENESQQEGWKLYGGLSSWIGIDMNIFSRFVKNYQEEVFSSEQILKRERDQITPSQLEGRIVFTRNDGESAEIMAMNANGSNITNLTQTNTAWEIFPSWSPDGRHIFFSKTRKTGSDISYNIYRMNTNGSGEVQITTGGDYKDHPTVSPNGDLIAYRAGLSKSQIWVSQIDGSNPVNITKDSQHVYENPSWSPDGNWIAFESDREKNTDSFIRDVFIMKQNGLNVRRLTYDKESRQPSWSPDGKLITFSSNRDGNWEIYVMDSYGNNPRNISNSRNSNERFPSWSPNGSNIVYSLLPAGSFSADTEEIWTMDYPSGANKKQLTNNDQQDSQPDWSPR